MSEPVVLVQLTQAHLRALEQLPELLADVRKLVRPDNGPLSASAVAKLVKRRPESVLKALRLGEIPALRVEGTHGGKGEFQVLPADALAWAKKTKPDRRRLHRSSAVA